MPRLGVCRTGSRCLALGWRPFGARRLRAELEIDCSDSPARVRSARSVKVE